MRTLALATGPELVRGRITDLENADLTPAGAVIELAVQADELEDAPTTGWTLRDNLTTIGNSTIEPAKLYTPVARGKFILWGRWTVGGETIVRPIGKFQVI